MDAMDAFSVGGFLKFWFLKTYFLFEEEAEEDEGRIFMGGEGRGEKSFSAWLVLMLITMMTTTTSNNDDDDEEENTTRSQYTIFLPIFLHIFLLYLTLP